MEDEFNIVIDTLQKKLNEIEEFQKGCRNISRAVGGGMGIMECIRYEQMDELREAIKREKFRLKMDKLREAIKREKDQIKNGGNENE